jgi:hypothetical protein
MAHSRLSAYSRQWNLNLSLPRIRLISVSSWINSLPSFSSQRSRRNSRLKLFKETRFPKKETGQSARCRWSTRFVRLNFDKVSLALNFRIIEAMLIGWSLRTAMFSLMNLWSSHFKFNCEARRKPLVVQAKKFDDGESLTICSVFALERSKKWFQIQQTCGGTDVRLWLDSWT